MAEASVWVGLGNVAATLVGLVAFGIAATRANSVVVIQRGDQLGWGRAGRAYYWHLMYFTSQALLTLLWFAGANFYLYWWRSGTDTYWQAAAAVSMLAALLPWAVLTRITGDSVGCRCCGGPPEDGVERSLRLAYAGGEFDRSFTPWIPFVDAWIFLVAFVTPPVLALALPI